MELVVVIAILGILAGLAIPRFMDATTNARGSRLVADLRTIESAESMYYAEKGQFTDMKGLVDNGYLAVEPIPPIGAFKVAETNQAGEIEDMNVLIQNSIWQSIPVASLKDYRPMKTLQDKGSWAPRQIELINKIDTKFIELANNIISACI